MTTLLFLTIRHPPWLVASSVSCDSLFVLLAPLCFQWVDERVWNLHPNPVRAQTYQTYLTTGRPDYCMRVLMSNSYLAFYIACYNVLLLRSYPKGTVGTREKIFSRFVRGTLVVFDPGKVHNQEHGQSVAAEHCAHRRLGMVIESVSS